MSLTQEQAVAKLQEVRDSYANLRRFLDSFWTLAVMYDGGKQWGRLTTREGRFVISRLRTIIDPKREDVRVTMDKTHEKVVQLSARLKPKKIAASVRPMGEGAVNDIIASTTCNHLLTRWAAQTQALSVLRSRDPIRTVLGEVIVRRTLTSYGNRKMVGEKSSIRNFNFNWDIAYPWEFIRDPAATTIEFDRDEEIIAHSKPRPIEWVKRHFGVDLKDTAKSSLGQLLDYQKQLFRARSNETREFLGDSRQLAVFVHECYYKDPDMMIHGDHRRLWAHQFIGWDDPLVDHYAIHPLHFGPNPFYGLPFHPFVCDRQVQAPWGRGVPHILMQSQDIVNLGMTWLLRQMQAGSGKLVIEKGTVEMPNRMLNNRLDVPLVWQRIGARQQFQKAPTRLQPPQTNPAVSDMLSRVPVWMDDMLNLTEVQRGITSKRGESGEAVKAKLSEANVPLEDMRRDDELALENLLYCTVVDLANPKFLRLDQARTLLASDVPDEHIRALLRKPVTKSIRSVTVHSLMTRPKTPFEAQDNLTTLVAAQVIEAEAAQWEMTVQGVGVNSLMGKARERQMTEIEMMINGEEVKVTMADANKYHRRTVEEFVESSQWYTLTVEVQGKILEHLAMHTQAEILKAQGEMQIEMANQPTSQGSPPKEAARAAAQIQPGAVAPAIAM